MNKTPKLLKQLWALSKSITRHYACPATSANFLNNNYPGAKYTTLENGLTIATEERLDSPIVCVGIYIDAGSRYESNFQNGMTHFFEHIAFKTTRNYKTAQLHAAMNCLGAKFGCFTTRDMTCYYAMCLVPKMRCATELLIECVFNNCLDCNEIESQKNIVYTEMLMKDNKPKELVFDLMHSAAFQGTGLENTVAGASTNLQGFTVDTLHQYLGKVFHPSRTVLAACGGVKHEQMEQIAHCCLSFKTVPQCEVLEYARYTGSDIRYRDDSMPMCNVTVAVEAPCFTSHDAVVMEVAKYAVGSWDRSQLDDDVLLANRLAQYASTYHCDAFKSFYIGYKDIGLWGVHFLAGAHSLDDMCTAVQDVWMYMCQCATFNDLERAKNIYLTKLLTSQQKVKDVCHDLGRWTLYYRCRPTLDQRVSAIKGVSESEFHNIVSKYVYDVCPVVAAIGQTEGMLDYQRVRGQMYWLRI